ncbi:MAG: hypothetical protein B6U72_02570 [Candidatus Altiarchaeales archaeon ex4484_2]|nr:MAG: hypothetical protein B6U72_02570 [Candidatus Altiarchaeales archaeon ex4484_2]
MEKDAKKSFWRYDAELRVFLFVVFGSIFLMHALSSLVWEDMLSMLVSGALGVMLVSYALKTKNGVQLTIESLTKTGGLFILYGMNLTYLMYVGGDYTLHRILLALMAFLVGVFLIRYTQKKKREGVKAV